MYTHREILRVADEVAEQLAATLPENGYWGFSTWTMIVPEILKHFSYALPQSDQIGPTWNYIDATCQGITGLRQFFDIRTHRPFVTKLKGIINCASSIQLCTLTAISASSLGPIGFAAAFGTTFLLSLDETIRQMRRMWSKEYFLMDSITELDKVSDLIQKEQDEIEKLRLENIPSYKLEKVLKIKQINLKELIKTQDKLKKIIEYILYVDIYESNKNKNKKQSVLMKVISNYSEVKNPDCKTYLENLKNKNKTVISKEKYGKVKKEVRQIKRDCKKACARAVSDTLIYGLAFTGMLFLCIPAMQPAALAIISTASFLFFIKNVEKIPKQLNHTCQFFKRISNHTPVNSPSIPREEIMRHTF